MIEPIKATRATVAISAAVKNRDCFNKSERSMYAKTEFLYLKEDRTQNVPLQKQKASDCKPLAS